MKEKTLLILIVIFILFIVSLFVCLMIDASKAPDITDTSIKCGALGYDKAFVVNAKGFGKYDVYCGTLMND